MRKTFEIDDSNENINLKTVCLNEEQAKLIIDAVDFNKRSTLENISIKILKIAGEPLNPKDIEYVLVKKGFYLTRRIIPKKPHLSISNAINKSNKICKLSDGIYGLAEWKNTIAEGTTLDESFCDMKTGIEQHDPHSDCSIKLKMRDIRAKHLDKRIEIKGLVTKTEMQYGLYSKAAFECLRCGHVTFVEQTLGETLEKPFAGCENETCGKNGPFKINDEESEIIDVQEIEIEEYKDEKAGRPPRFMKVFLLGDAAVETSPEGAEKLFIGTLGQDKIKNRKIEYVLRVDTVKNISNKSEFISETRDQIKKIRYIIKEVSEKHPGGKVPLEEVYIKAEQHGIDRTQTEKHIKNMLTRGDLFKPDSNHIKLVP